MQKLLKQFQGAANYEAQAIAAQKIWHYANKHPMASCTLSPEDMALYNAAINFFN